MNHSQLIILVLSSFIFLYIGSVDAISCYVCKSEKDPDCESSNPPKSYIKDCKEEPQGSQYKACRKIENNVDFKVLTQEPIKRVIRQCAIDVDRDRACYYRAGFGGRANVCDCFEDECNSASLPISSLVTLVVTLVVFLKTIA